MPEEIKDTLIENEMKESYIDYAMSVIVGRALPDVRDGLKPVHRRILYAMNELGLQNNKPYKKCARIVGETLGKYHPHGDMAVYDSLVRMAQSFSLRYPLIEGQGNFGSLDGDSPAAQRYTEAKLSKIASEMLQDIEKETVKFVDNFDGSLKEPEVLPAKIPNLLLNGSSGIAVGMATNIPPHNLNEVCTAITKTIDNPEIDINEIISIMPGPDFPTGAYICGKNGIKSYYLNGKGKLILRAKTKIEEIKDKRRIIIEEIPYQVNKANLVEAIADLVKEKVIEDVSDIRDESDKKGVRVVIELKRNANPELILNQLYKHSQLQITFGVIMLALHKNQPKVMNIKDFINHYIQYRKEIITKRTKFDLDKAEKKAHILEGLRIALNNIDPVIKLIKGSKNPDEAKKGLVKNFKLTEVQSQAILDMRLHRLTSLEQEKIKEEYENLLKLIKELKEILASEKMILEIIKKELNELKEKYTGERKTQILDVEEEIDVEDLIPEEDIVITATYSGYIKRTPLELYKQQRRGGKGIIATETKEEDTVEHLFVTNSKSTLLLFTNTGRVHWLKTYQVPEASRYSKGKAIINLLSLDQNERVTAMIPIKQFKDDNYLIMVTKKGLIKKTPLFKFAKPRKGGITGITLKEKDDELAKVRLTPGILTMIIGTKKGFALKFKEEDVRSMGRTASGVRGIRLRKDDEVIGLEVSIDSASLLTVTENGYGKRTVISDYRLTRRGGKGVINIKTSPRNGNVIGIKTVKDHDEIILITKKGIVIRTPVNNISNVGRNTQGVRVMKLNEGDKVNNVTRVIQQQNQNHQ